MSLLLAVARIAALVNVALLLSLGYVWIGSYRRHGASHTLALLVFAGFLFVQNILWLYMYVVHEQFVDWFVEATMDMQAGLMALCGLETAALAFLTYITWR